MTSETPTRPGKALKAMQVMEAAALAQRDLCERGTPMWNLHDAEACAYRHARELAAEASTATAPDPNPDGWPAAPSAAVVEALNEYAAGRGGEVPNRPTPPRHEALREAVKGRQAEEQVTIPAGWVHALLNDPTPPAWAAVVEALERYEAHPIGDYRADLIGAVRAAAGGAVAIQPTAPAEWFPKVAGQCPACKAHSLFLGDGGWVTCSVAECPNPTAWADAMDDGAVAVPEDRPEAGDEKAVDVLRRMALDEEPLSLSPEGLGDGCTYCAAEAKYARETGSYYADHLAECPWVAACGYFGMSPADAREADSITAYPGRTGSQKAGR